MMVSDYYFPDIAINNQLAVIYIANNNFNLIKNGCILNSMKTNAKI